MRCRYGSGAGTGELEGLATDQYGGIASLAVGDYVYLTDFYAHAGVATGRDYWVPEIEAFGAGSGVNMPIASNVNFIAEATYVSAKTSI